ncbi:MAG: glycosyltransferase family 2 protein [Chloroflexi bacterium]|nr:glycosyltransferase family 2 protein [Chloroflexota bacterium]
MTSRQSARPYTRKTQPARANIASPSQSAIMPDVSIIIVNWNAKGFLEGCLESLHRDSCRATFEVLVIDNASEDGSAAMVALRFPHVKIIANGDNRGFAKANNQGILQSEGRHILLLNPDTVVFAGALDSMVDYLDNHCDVGAVGPRTIGPRGETLESFSFFPGPRLLLRGMAIIAVGSYYRDEKLKSLAPRQVDWVGGACLLVRREALAEVGLLDEAFFMYWEEADLCLRLRQKRWKTYYLPEPKIIHYLGRSAAQADRVLIHGILLQEWARSAERMLKKHYPFWVRSLFRAAVLGMTAVSLLFWLGVYAASPSRRANAREIIRAYSLVLGIIHRPPAEGGEPR